MAEATFESVAAEFAAMPDKVVRQGRGVGAKALDRGADVSRQKALATWTVAGRGMAGSAGTITARMSRSDALAGYIIGDGDGLFFSEVGTGMRPPKPVLADGLMVASEVWQAQLAEIGARL